MTNRGIDLYTGTTKRWTILENSVPESGSNSGSDLLITGDIDAGTPNTMGALIQATRGSGPFGDGPPQFSQFAPYTMMAPRAVNAGGTIGNNVTLEPADAQPQEMLGSNPITTTTSSSQITVSWMNCCGSGNPLYNSGTGGMVDSWVDIGGSTAIGSVTPAGWYEVTQILSANSFLADCAGQVGCPVNSGSGATGGGTSVTIVPSYNTIGQQFNVEMTAGAMAQESGGTGFIDGTTTRLIWNPSYYIPNGSPGSAQAQMFYEQCVSPNDTTGNNLWGVNCNERDLIYRGAPPSYSFNLRATHNFMAGMYVGAWGPVQNPPISGGGTATNVAADYVVASSPGLGNLMGFTCQPNAIEGGPTDPSGHGGVCNDDTGSWVQVSSYTTTASSNVVTITIPASSAGPLSDQISGTSMVLLAVTAICNGVTLTANTYTISSISIGASTSTFKVTGSGSGSAGSCTASASQWASFQSHVAFSPMVVRGEWTNGIVQDSQSKIDGNGGGIGYFVASQVGAGIGGCDSSPACAGIQTSESSLGNITTNIVSAGTGVVQVNGSTVKPTLSGTTASIGGSALLAGACSSGTATISGLTTGMAILTTPVTYPGDGNYWLVYESAANTATVKVCAVVANTPSASVYNVRVLQ